MATVASFLDDVAAFAEGGADLLRTTEVFSLNSHSIKPNRMAALAEPLQLFGMALSTFFWKDHGLLFGGCLMVNMAGHTMDPLLCMFRFDP